MSANALNKIAPNSPSRQSPSEIETSIANASFPLSIDMRPQTNNCTGVD
jgi:small subunit ribosomal protein S7e